MGYYFNHGIEYVVKAKDGKEHVLVTMNESDERLLASNYYAKRKDTWFSNEVVLKNFREKIEEPDFDVVLTEKEKQILKETLKESPNASHGWYEVNHGEWYF